MRYLIAPQLDLRHGQGGTVQPRSDGFAAASDATLRRSRRALLKTARRLLRRASDYLESHAAQFPLYDPQANVLNRCSIDGKLWYRPVSGAAAALAGWFAPIVPLVACVFGFIAVDFLTGVAASRAVTARRPSVVVRKRRGVAHGAENSRSSPRASSWRGPSTATCSTSWICTRRGSFTGFACGVEFWSFLENAAQLSDAPLFRWLKRYVRRRMRKEAGDV